ncbi:MAG: hypothetical protein OEU84_17385 [Xanthomonadales bacterium]|nr:hypothetical protein [Xanthomonadales bacterium]MDH4021369.1 hypothetical protein [Xanthomonadales bacterium]
MQIRRQKPKQTRTGKKTGIWLALVCAIALHAIVLLLPVARQLLPEDSLQTSIELQLTTFSPRLPALLEPLAKPEILPPEPEPQTEAGMASDDPIALPEIETEVSEDTTESASVMTSPVVRNLQPDLERMSEPEKTQLTNTILARQFFTEESATEQIFGKPFPQNNTEIRKEFHYPARPDLMAMLDQPLPEVPFEYTPDLVYFAYDPGVKGDLQRFWDVITPEFGWRTKYGTEVKCIMVLVIIGCGWK